MSEKGLFQHNRPLGDICVLPTADLELLRCGLLAGDIRETHEAAAIPHLAGAAKWGDLRF